MYCRDDGSEPFMTVSRIHASLIKAKFLHIATLKPITPEVDFKGNPFVLPFTIVRRVESPRMVDNLQQVINIIREYLFRKLSYKLDMTVSCC
jgi:hypothetical protein